MRPGRKRRGFGALRKLPSGRWQASHMGPDGRRHTCPGGTFATRKDAESWLAAAQTAISNRDWRHPAHKHAQRFGEYADAWLDGRMLRARTRDEYRKLLNRHLRPAFGDQPLDEISPVAVRTWHAELAAVTGPTRQAHAYGLLRTILNTAVADEVIAANPCRVRGAGQVKRKSQTKPATVAEIGTLVENMPTPRYRLAVLLAAWCGLRFGEIAELRRRDVDLRAGELHVRRAVVSVNPDEVPDPLPPDTRVCSCDAGCLIGPPKSDAGVRDVAIPPHLLPTVRTHLAEHTVAGRDALLFPAPTGKHLGSDGALHRDFHVARLAAGRPDLRFHDLRHTGATLAAAAGATVADLMHRLGHATPVAAMRYRDATPDRDKAIAEALSGLHAAQVVELRPAGARSSGNTSRRRSTRR